MSHHKPTAEEQLKSLREYVREKAAIDTTLKGSYEAGGREQVNYRAGMRAAYRDIEKRLEGKQQ